MVAMGQVEYCKPEYAENFRHNGLFLGGNTRAAIAEGRGDFTPSFFFEVPRLFHSTVWHEEQILLAVPAAFSVNRGLEEFQLTAAQVREGVHLQENFPAVDLSRFAQEPFLLLKQGNDLNQRAYKLCRNAGFLPKIVLELDQLLTACCIARDGKGCTFLRDGMARFLEDGGRLVYYKLGDPAAHRPVMLAWRKSAELSRPAKALLEFLTGTQPQAQKDRS